MNRGSRAIIFVSIFIVHSVAQFTVFAHADSPLRSGGSMLIWNILAAPLFHITGSLTNQYFWTIAIANSVLWAAVLTYVIVRLATRDKICDAGSGPQRT